MPRSVKLLAFVLAGVLALGACASTPEPTIEHAARADQTLILISLDGFRWDFIHRGLTPTLSRLAREGVHAERLVPSFPTKTFPNHYTIVTGLRPEEHGLVANNMYDPELDSNYSLSNRAAVGDGAWYGGEPIWVTAERQGVNSGTLFWPGSEAPIQGVRPAHYRPYDGDMSPEDRVDLILEWLELPEEERPRFLTLYFEDVDDAAHAWGPEPSAGLARALAIVDGAIERLVEGLDRRHLSRSVNLLITSDHGMSSTSKERIVFLDDYVDLDRANVVDWSPILGLWPPDEDLEEVHAALANAHPSLTIYRREEIPDYLEYSNHPRIPKIIGIADDGWSISTRQRLADCPRCFDGGTHGYHRRLASMGALLIGHGPVFRQGLEAGPTDNIHLYHLMCQILDLEPAPNSGDPIATSHFLADPPSNRHARASRQP